ncbi:hypothetical protein ACMYZ5_09890 [Bacteroides sp. KG68]|uniref:hypothetical protein n=1 Tax=unclassified Bacteroides TaxID=2646097 RepID=UPI003D973B65
MSKNILSTLCIAFCIIGFFACEERKEEYPDIRIGKEKTSVDELSLNKQTEKRLIVSGGNGKYIVNVENSQIATAQMSMDTLKVKGLLEGETFATILSHDKRVRLKINVTFPELGISHSTVLLRPKDISKFVSISGGGERVTLQENDPADVIDIKWDGSTGMLEITPKYEGEAEVTAVSEDGKEQKTIRISVKPEGELKVPGWYDTTKNSYYVMLNNKMIVKRKGVGTWIIDSARPYGGEITTYTGSHIKIAPIVNPVKGDSIDLNVLDYSTSHGKIKKGVHRLYVEEVGESEVMLRGKGFKFLLPYQK